MKKITTLDMEIALTSHFNPYTRNLVVPNVYWGLFEHECDLLVLTEAGYAYEIEIKISKADLLKDRKKKHGHRNNKIKYLYFAIPEYLLEFKEHIPERAGIIVVNPFADVVSQINNIIRKPKVNSKYKFTPEERYQLARLGAIRIWTLKRNIRDLKKV